MWNRAFARDQLARRTTYSSERQDDESDPRIHIGVLLHHPLNQLMNRPIASGYHHRHIPARKMLVFPQYLLAEPRAVPGSFRCAEGERDIEVVEQRNDMFRDD